MITKTYIDTVVPEVGIGIAVSDDDYGYSKAQVTMTRGDDVNGLISFNTAFYIETADFTTGTYFQLGTIAEDLIKPNCYITFPGVEILAGSLFADGTGAAFGGTQELDKVSYLINASGEVFVWVKTVTSSATLAAVDYLIFPIVVTYTKIVEQSVVILP